MVLNIKKRDRYQGIKAVSQDDSIDYDMQQENDDNCKQKDTSGTKYAWTRWNLCF